MVTYPEFEIIPVGFRSICSDPFSPDDIYELLLRMHTPQVTHLLSKDRYLLRQGARVADLGPSLSVGMPCRVDCAL